jgi:glutamine---fructose-6-phosphate transaminase (isomerizing)
MCGIFGYIGQNQAAGKLVHAGLKRLEYRGYDSWGVAVVPQTDGVIAIKKQVGKIGSSTVSDLPAGTLAFGHTRWATHGGVTTANSHPHLDCSGQIAVIHNGIFENYESHKKQLVAQGHTFLSETDSEVIAHLIEDHRKTKSFFEAVRQTFLTMEGMNAFIAIAAHERCLVAVRNGSPLVVGLASDPAALLTHTHEVYFLEDGEMAVVTDNAIEIFASQTGQKLAIKKTQLAWNTSQVEKGTYADYMLKEIYEQPQVVTDIAANASTHLQKIAKIVRAAEQVSLVGCGTAAHACQMGYYFFSNIPKRSVQWAIGSEFSYQLNTMSPQSLILALSQSGETMDILEPLKKAKLQGIKIIALVNVLGSSLYRLADEKILLAAGPEQAVASTKAFTAKLAQLLLLAYASGGRLIDGVKILTTATTITQQVLSTPSVTAIKKLAKLLKDTEHLYCLGRGMSYPIALEAALKIKEISYIHAEGLPTGELKHGTLALIEKGTPCLIFLPNDETYTANLNSAKEIKARGGYVIGISFKPDAVFDYYLEVAPNTVTAQLLAYYLTLERKLDPDMPRNLAKSVTVK